jgi:hypothetical protein
MAAARTCRAIALDEQGRCQGVISLADVALYERQLLTGHLEKSIARREVATNYRSS